MCRPRGLHYLHMDRLLQTLIVLTAALSVAIADYLLKRVAAATERFADAFIHPLTALAVGLYAVQVVLFTYVFVRRWQLGTVALLQMACYAAACLLMSRFWLGERVTAAQAAGMVMAFCGAVLMTR